MLQFGKRKGITRLLSTRLYKFRLWVHQHWMISPLICVPCRWPTLPNFSSLWSLSSLSGTAGLGAPLNSSFLKRRYRSLQNEWMKSGHIRTTSKTIEKKVSNERSKLRLMRQASIGWMDRLSRSRSTWNQKIKNDWRRGKRRELYRTRAWMRGDWVNEWVIGWGGWWVGECFPQLLSC